MVWGAPTDRVIKPIAIINTQVLGCQEMMTSVLEQGSVATWGALPIKSHSSKS